MSACRIAQPGRPVELVRDVDPFAGLSQRQREILDIVRSCNGNRSRAARHLGINTAAVQAALRLAERAGAPIPQIARRGPDLHQRKRSA